MGVALKVENVSIRYITGDFKDIGVKEYVVRNLTHQYHVNEFMAVRDVSFQLEQGDMLGIVGANGAGKSTLLKVIAGIMAPTKGSVTAFGEVAALLELASGFDGDLTVRENAYLRGAMLGYTKDFMDRTYEQIIDFAELHGFEDRPFKQLSSGMKSRLAFSIASLVQPDILILDEVLSVGDGAFQEKSAKKMREIIDQGATTILVSHSLGQIRELCNKVLWLDHGRQVAFGETREICDQYERFLSSGQMPAASETVPAREAAAQTDVPRPKKKRFRAAALLSAVVLGAFAAMVVQAGVSNILQTSGVNEDSILIYSDTLDCPVTYRGATAAGGTWVSPWDNVKASGGWSFDEIQATYTATDGSPLEISLPKGSGRALTFDAGPDQGTARVVVGGETIYIDCYNETTVELGLPHSLPDSAIVGENLPYIVSGIAFILMAGSVIVLNRQKSAPPHKDNGQKREAWGDLLRIVCCGVIIVLHNTCNIFDDYAEGRLAALVINCFTAFAVPCFFMLSGAYLLRKTHSIQETVFQRVPRTFVPVLFWGGVYIFVEGDLRIERFLLLPFQESTAHLWFMYSLFGIYMLLPLLSKLYHSLSFREKLYLLGLLTFVPMVVYDGAKLLGGWVPAPKFALLWPELGLFFCGGLLWELREKIKGRRPALYGFIFLIGFAATTIGTVISSAYAGVPDKSFISTIGTAGNILMAGSVICFALTLDGALTKKIPDAIRGAISGLGQLTMGIYFIHVLFLNILNCQTIPWLPLYSNMGSMAAMIVSAFVYFCLSATVCACAKRVRGISGLF